MRVLHCIPTLGTGGAERQLVHLIASSDARVESHVAYLIDGTHAAALREAGAVLHALPARRTFDPRTIADLRALIAAIRPDLVQSWLPRMDTLAGLASRGGTPWILSERTSAANYPRDLRNLVRRKLGRRAEAIVANSAGGAAYWLANGARPERVHVIPNAVATTPMGSSPRDPHAVLFVGRLSPEKNIPLLLEAIRELPDVTLTLCGDGPLRQALEQQVATLGVAHRVVLAGETADVATRLQTDAVAVMPSRFEGRPNAVLEAMAAGCPLAVSDIAAHRELLDESTAVFFDADAPSIARALRAVLADRAAASRRAQQAQRLVADWTPAHIADRYLDVYRQLLGQ